MMKQFGKSMLTVMGLALAAAVLSAIPAQASGSSTVAHAFVPGVAWFTPAGDEVVEVTIVRTAKTYMLFYNVVDFGGGFSAGGSGTIPASIVAVSGGSVSTDKVTVTLNVNTCTVPGFTTNYGPCGTFNLAWVEVPPSVAGSFATRGDTQITFPGGSKVTTNGQMMNVGAQVTGTALGFDAPTGTYGGITEETNVTVTVTQ